MFSARGRQGADPYGCGGSSYSMINFIKLIDYEELQLAIGLDLHI